MHCFIHKKYTMAIQSEEKQFPVKSYFLQNLNVPLIGLALTVV